jgi:hypothetical protein
MFLKSFILALFLFVYMALQNLAWAGPPFVTDDPEPVEYKRWEVNYAVSGEWNHGDTSAALPSIDINYGLTPDLQLHIQPRYSYEKQGKRKYGFDSIEVGAKYRFVETGDEHSKFMMSFYPLLQLPTGDTKLGEGRNKLQTLLPIWMQHETDDWNIYGGAGYRINQGVDAKNSWFVGSAALYNVTSRLQLGGEVFHETASEKHDKDTFGFNLGGIYKLVDDYSILFSAGRGVNNNASATQFAAFLGLQAVY